ncbi:Protein arginine N-methyltransferase 5 [Nowakowskiella sp. JEL0407]|nr:Protein arginine N-methyltransferase 5 [Nowakowskiella sp. JEL0407]
MQDAQILVGLELDCGISQSDLSIQIANEGYAFGLLQLTFPNFSSLDLPLKLNDNVASFTPEEVNLLTTATPTQPIHGTIANWLELDSSDPLVRLNSEIWFSKEIQWATHLGLSACFFPWPLSQDASNFSRYLNSAISASHFTDPVLRIPFLEQENSWVKYNQIRTLCDHTPRLLIALQFPEELPDDVDDQVQRWFAEPVKYIILPASLFLTNAKGFPVLSKKMQGIINPQFIILSHSIKGHHQNGGLSAYAQYIQYLYRQRPESGVIDQFATGYHDYLQAPLQPLMDNLEAATYEVFEQDPVKYRLYQLAVEKALLDRMDEDTTVVIMVVGAGPRGPLVDCCLRAATKANCKVRLYAVEKNPNAVVTLRKKRKDVWGDSVTVVHSDMRAWVAPEKCDILVSELLGSFGDNELSPECLDGAQSLLKETGISIPANYTSFVAPISSHKLYNEVMAYKDLKSMETPYVVKFRSVRELAESKETWVFNHPTEIVDAYPGTIQFNAHNKRYASVTFEVRSDSLMHGIAGYFESVLYNDVILSINPKTHSTDMFSWFPLFFPIKHPLFIPSGSQVQINLWRCGDARRVWYEWCVVVSKDGKFLNGTELHNPGGRSYFIGL